MRSLTIRREKSFVACLSRMKVYVEDQVSGDLKISGVPCRLLGVVKNGEEKTFEIGGEALKVFVIADKPTRNICNDCYPLPSGEEDVCLSVGVKRDAFNGYVYLFRNNDSEWAYEHRKSVRRRSNRMRFVCFVVAFVIGVGIVMIDSAIVSKEVFSKHGMSITLTDEFYEYNEEGFDVAYYSDDVAVLGIFDSYDVNEQLRDLTLPEYCDLIIEKNQLTSKPETVDGLMRVCFEAEGRGESYTYMAYMFKIEDGFWIIQFAFESDDILELEPSVSKWAQSIEFY